MLSRLVINCSTCSWCVAMRVIRGAQASQHLQQGQECPFGMRVLRCLRMATHREHGEASAASSCRYANMFTISQQGSS